MNEISDIDVLILCGGLGTRLRGVEDDKPKVMVDINGRPFLDIVLDHLIDQGVERVVLATGYKASVIENYYRNKDLGVVIDFSQEQEPLGTGGAVKNAQEIIDTDSFIVLNGDSFCPTDLNKLLTEHLSNENVATIAVSKVDNADDYGSISVDEDLNVLSFQEKEQGMNAGYVNAGVYCFSQEVFDMMPSKKNFSLEKDVFPVLVDQGIGAFVVDEKFLDIGTPARLTEAKKKLND